MFILHVISSIDLNSGGPSKSVLDLAIKQAILNNNVFILSIKSDNPYTKDSFKGNLKIYLVDELMFFFELKKLFSNYCFDICHGHGIWDIQIHLMVLFAKKNGLPFLISPRGMLEPWALNTGKWKKKLAMAIYQRGDLARAACIHATAKMEANNIRNLGFSNPIAVIPNGIDVFEFPMRMGFEERSIKTLLFLSRIHPKKGIELLVEAWSLLDKNKKLGWKVEIVGNGDVKYLKSLEKLILEKGLESEITMLGPKFGENKLAAYQRADLFVLPTYSENFGIVVAEALACGIPVITTKGTPWEDLDIYNAGWWIEIGVYPLVEALKKAITLSDYELKLMGLSGRRLIEEKYSIESVAKHMESLYFWMLNKGEKSDFIYEKS